MSIFAKITDPKKLTSMQVSARFTSVEEKFVEKFKINDFGLTEDDLKAFYNEVKSTPPKAEATSSEPKAPKEPKVKAEKAPKEPKVKVEKAPKEPKVKVERNASDLPIEGKLLEIFESTTLAKSDKFRQLHAEGVSIGQITRLFESHYSFVKSAVTRELKPEGEKKPFGKKKEVAVEEVLPTQSGDAGTMETAPASESSNDDVDAIGNVPTTESESETVTE